jgi:hypothetical protein
MRLSPSDDSRPGFICFAGFYKVLQPSGRVSREEQLELSQGFAQLKEEHLAAAGRRGRYFDKIHEEQETDRGA